MPVKGRRLWVRPCNDTLGNGTLLSTCPFSISSLTLSSSRPVPTLPLPLYSSFLTPYCLQVIFILFQNLLVFPPSSSSFSLFRSPSLLSVGSSIFHHLFSPPILLYPLFSLSSPPRFPIPVFAKFLFSSLLVVCPLTLASSLSSPHLSPHLLDSVPSTSYTHYHLLRLSHTSLYSPSSPSYFIAFVLSPSCCSLILAACTSLSHYLTSLRTSLLPFCSRFNLSFLSSCNPLLSPCLYLSLSLNSFPPLITIKYYNYTASKKCVRPLAE